MFCTFKKDMMFLGKIFKQSISYYLTTYSRGKKDTDPYNISPIEMRSL